MRIYNSPQTSPTPSKKISNDGPSKSTTPKNLSLLQEKMLAYQTKAAEAEEVYTPTSHARRDTYQSENIDLKDRMATWEKQPEPEIEQPVLEDDVAAVEEEILVVEEEPLSLAERMAKFKEQSASDKFSKSRAQQEIEEAKRLKEEEELRLKKEEEERLKPKMIKVASRRASSEIQKRMAAWGEKVEEDTPEVPAPIVEESVMDEEKEDVDMEQDTPIVNDEPVTKSPKQAPYKRPADMPETSNLLKERMACWGGGSKEKEEEQSVEEVAKKEEVDVVDEIAARVAEMIEDKPADEVPPISNDEPKPQAPKRTTPRKSALLEEKLNAYTQAGATDENTDLSPYKKKPIDMPDLPKLTEKLSAYTQAGKANSDEKDQSTTPKKKKPIDMPVTPNSSLRDKMNAYKAGSTREFSRSAGATDLDPDYPVVY